MACYINRPHEPDSLLSPAAGGYWPVALRFWRGHGAVRAWLLTLMLIVFIMLQLALQYRMNLWSRDFFDAFGRREAATLRSQALLFMLLAGLSILVAIVLVWVRMTIQRTWRVWLTRLLIGRWLAHERFHRLRFPAGEDENPEYRIAEDVRVATDTPVNMVNGLFAAIIGAVVFIGILWNVGGDLSIEIYGRSLMVPKYLVISVVVYSAMLSLGMMLIGRGMMRVITGKNAAEAQFRALASKVRERGAREPANGDGASARTGLDASFSALTERWRELCHQLMRTTFISQGNTLVAPVIGWVLCAPKYLSGTMSLGEVAQAVSAFVMVQAALNWIVDNYPGLADCLSSIRRVETLLHALDEIAPEDDRPPARTVPDDGADGRGRLPLEGPMPPSIQKPQNRAADVA